MLERKLIKHVISSGAKRSREICKSIKFNKITRFLPSVEMTKIGVFVQTQIKLATFHLKVKPFLLLFQPKIVQEGDGCKD